jgi:hypothetical protein
VAGAVLHARSGEMFHPTPDGLSGETLDLEPPREVEAPPEAEPASASATATATAPATAPAPATATGVATAAAPPPLPFGAVGVRYATDLATTFTRSFPQAASSDPAWNAAPLGGAGSAIVSFVIDENGHLESSAVLGAPGPALRRGIERTLAVLESRPFTASAAITRLKVTARVSRDDVHDGLHGEVFAVSGGSFSHDVGAAFFALPARPASSGQGRRVDVEVRLLP